MDSHLINLAKVITRFATISPEISIVDCTDDVDRDDEHFAPKMFFLCGE